MNKTCGGCGAMLQCQDRDQEGYIDARHFDLASECERCFRLKHYNEYQMVLKKPVDFLTLLKTIDLTGNLVVFVVDALAFPEALKDIRVYLHNPLLLVITKQDLCPSEVKEEKILRYIEHFSLKPLQTLIVSSKKNYHLDELWQALHQFTVQPKIYFVGYTNAGKSTLINQLIYHYSNLDHNITTSPLPSTTLNFIEIPLTDITIIDTPGLLENGSYLELAQKEDIQKIVPQNKIKARIYQIKTPQTLLIDHYVRVFTASVTTLIFYVSNRLIIERIYKKQLDQENFTIRKIHVEAGTDVVIRGLGFIKVLKECHLELALPASIIVDIRPALF